MTGKPLIPAGLLSSVRSSLLAGLAMCLPVALAPMADAQCSCEGKTKIRLTGKIPGFKVAGAGAGPASKIEVELKPEREYDFELSSDDTAGCLPGTVSFCGVEYQLMYPGEGGAPSTVSGWYKGSQFDVLAINGDLTPAAFRLRLVKRESDSSVSSGDSTLASGGLEVPAGATPPVFNEGTGQVLQPGAAIAIPLGTIGMGANNTAPFRSAGVLSWNGPIAGTLSKAATAEYNASEEIKGRTASVWGPAIAAKLTYATDFSYPEEKHIVTPTRVFRVTGYVADPAVVATFSTAPNTYVREYARASATESKYNTFRSPVVSWWKVSGTTNQVTVEQSVEGILSWKTFLAPSANELEVLDGDQQRRVMLVPPTGTDLPYYVSTSITKGTVKTSEVYQTFIKTAAGYQLDSEITYPDPTSAANGLLTKYKYYPAEAGENAGKLWWVCRPDCSWSAYEYPEEGDSIEYSPFASETLLNPNHSILNTLPCIPAAGLTVEDARVRLRKVGALSSQEYVQTLQGVVEDHDGDEEGDDNAVLVSQTSAYGAQDVEQLLPDGVPLVEMDGTISYSQNIVWDSPNRWLAGRTVLTRSDSGRASFFTYEKNAQGHVTTTRTTGVATLDEAPNVGDYRFRTVAQMSEREITINGPEGIMSREVLYHTGSDFTSAKQETFHYLNGRYHRTTVDGVEVDRKDRPDPFTVIEKDAKGKVTTTKYDIGGKLLWTEDAAGGGVGKIRTSTETVGFTTTTRVNGTITSEFVVDGLGRTVTSKDEMGAETSYNYPHGGREVEITLPGDILRKEERYLDGELKARSGNGWVAEFHSMEPNETTKNGYFLTRSTGSSTGHSARKTTQEFSADGKLVRTLTPSPADAANSIEELYEYRGDMLVSVVTSEVDAEGYFITDLPDQLLFETTWSPFDSDAVIIGGLEISGLDLDGTSSLSLNTYDRFTRREASYFEDGPVVYRRILEYRYPDASGADPLITEKQESVSFITSGANGYSSINKLLEPSGRSLTTTTAVAVDIATVTVTEDDSAVTTSTSDTITTEENGFIQSVQRAGSTRPETFIYDERGRLKRHTDHRNASTYSYHSGNSQLQDVTDQLGNITSFTYYLPDEANAGKLKTVTRPGGIVETTAYNPRGQITEVSGSGNYRRVYDYDDFGDRITMETYGTQTALTRWTYQPGTGLLEKKRYNDATQPAAWFDFKYDYTPDGKLARRTTGKGVETEYLYDEFTRDLTNINYSNDDNLTPDVEFSEFDGFGRPGKVEETKSVTDPHINVQYLTYQRHSEEVSTRYENGHRWLSDVIVRHKPETLGRPAGFDITVGPGEALVASQAYGYDDYSHLNAVDGRLDELDNVSPHATVSHVTGGEILSGVDTWVGSGLAHRRTLSIDLIGRTGGVVNKAGGGLATVASIGTLFDQAGRPETVRREDGSKWTYGYNDRSEVTSANKRSAENNLVPGLNFVYNFDGMGNRITSTSGTGAGVSTRSYGRNVLNQYTSITHDGKVNVLVRSDAAVTATATNATHNAVTQEGKLYGIVQTAIDFSANGKLVTTTAQRAGGGTSQVQTWVPPATIQPRTGDNGSLYDPDGNLRWDGRWEYTWDAENRLVSLTTAPNATAGLAPNVTLKFAYDWMGRRIGKTVTKTTGTTHVSYAYDRWNLVAEWTRTSLTTLIGNTPPQRTYLWGVDKASSTKASFGVRPDYQSAGGVAGLVASVFRNSNGTKEVFVPSYDTNGNIIGWTDGSGTLVQRMDYDPFGNPVMVEKIGIPAQTDKLPSFGFSTKPCDVESGLYYYGFRYYDPITGRWPSRDPMGELEDDPEATWNTNPGRQLPVSLRFDKGFENLYGFALNRPVSSIDVLGLYTIDDAIASLKRRGVFGGMPGGRFYTAKQKYYEWLRLEAGNAATKWWSVLPKCPGCLTFKAGLPENPDNTVWEDPAKPSGAELRLHPGTVWSMRSKKVGAHSNQCTYDAFGLLLIDPAGAGTVDYRAPAVSWDHFDHDVEPIIMAAQLDGNIPFALLRGTMATVGPHVLAYYKVRPLWGFTGGKVTAATPPP